MVPTAINQVELIGEIGAEPTLYDLPATPPVCMFWVATDLSWRDSNGCYQDALEWHRLVAWGVIGTWCYSHLGPQTLVFARGHLTTRSWQVAPAHTQFTTEIVATQVLLLRLPPAPGSSEELPLILPNERATEPYEPPQQPDAVMRRFLTVGQVLP